MRWILVALLALAAFGCEKAIHEAMDRRPTNDKLVQPASANILPKDVRPV